MTFCCIPSCCNNSHKTNTCHPKISYFAIQRPDLGKKSHEERIYWKNLTNFVIKICGSKKDIIERMLRKQTACICEVHFDCDDIIIRKTAKVLKIGAMPSKNLSKQESQSKAMSFQSIKSTSSEEIASDTVEVDDEVVFVGTSNPEIMSHFRSDCPLHHYIKIERINELPHETNSNFCSKCFCYICDKLANDCEDWTDLSLPHCNANSKSSCWKARRNLTKSPLMHELNAEEITPQVQAAGLLATAFIIGIREAYLLYKAGTPCEFSLVPCQCLCHKKLSENVCCQCEAIHSSKKKFNYAPVEETILRFFHEVQKKYKNDPYSALVLYEAILSEVCTHRPADFNRVLNAPSNPDVQCQCRTPQLLRNHFEGEFIKIFVLNEIDCGFSKKFIGCVCDAVDLLQVRSLMKRFFGIKLWSNLLLRAVLSGQNTSGKSKNDVLRESLAVVKFRVEKLKKDGRHLAVTRYLNAVKLERSSRPNDNGYSEDLMEFWTIESMLMRGMFRAACDRYFGNLESVRGWNVAQMVKILNLMQGKGLPPGTKLVSSYRSNIPVIYEIDDVDETVLLLVFLVFAHISHLPLSDFSYCHWLTAYVNRAEVAYNRELELEWIRQSDKLLALSRGAYNESEFRPSSASLFPIGPQAAVFVCSSFLVDHFSKKPADLKRVPEVIEAFKKHDWGLFFIFSNPSLFGRGNQLVTKWLISYMTRSDITLYQFIESSFQDFLIAGLIADIFTFMNQWASPRWKQKTPSFIGYFIRICSIYACRVKHEAMTKRQMLTTFFCNDLLLDVVRTFAKKTLELNPEWIKDCQRIAYACCFVDLDNIEWCLDVFHDSDTKAARKAEVFLAFLHKFQRKMLSSDNTVKLFKQAVKQSNMFIVEAMVIEFSSKHFCQKNCQSYGFLRMFMNEVIEMIDCYEFVPATTKRNLIMTCCRVFVNDFRGWIVCFNCTNETPLHWKKLCLALKKSGMDDCLHYVADHTLSDYSTLLSGITIKNCDIDRLIQRMQTFLWNLAFTLIFSCGFDAEKLRERVLSTRDKINHASLSTLYRDLVHRIFDVMKSGLLHFVTPDSVISDDLQACLLAKVKIEAGHLLVEKPEPTNDSPSLASREPGAYVMKVEELSSDYGVSFKCFESENCQFTISTTQSNKDLTSLPSIKNVRSQKDRKVMKRKGTPLLSTNSFEIKRKKFEDSSNVQMVDRVRAEWQIPSGIKIPPDFVNLTRCRVDLRPFLLYKEINQSNRGTRTVYA